MFWNINILKSVYLFLTNDLVSGKIPEESHVNGRKVSSEDTIESPQESHNNIEKGTQDSKKSKNDSKKKKDSKKESKKKDKKEKEDKRNSKLSQGSKRTSGMGYGVSNLLGTNSISYSRDYETETLNTCQVRTIEERYLLSSNIVPTRFGKSW